MNRSRGLHSIITYGVAIVIAALVGFPLLWMVISSLRTSAELFTSPPTLLPLTFTLVVQDRRVPVRRAAIVFQ
jgi:ABC-type glycerol-3-phosphate transport system permease component